MNKRKFLSTCAINTIFVGLTAADGCSKGDNGSGNSQESQNNLSNEEKLRASAASDVMFNTLLNSKAHLKDPNGKKGRELNESDREAFTKKFIDTLSSMKLTLKPSDTGFKDKIEKVILEFVNSQIFNEVNVDEVFNNFFNMCLSLKAHLKDANGKKGRALQESDRAAIKKKLDDALPSIKQKLKLQPTDPKYNEQFAEAIGKFLDKLLFNEMNDEQLEALLDMQVLGIFLATPYVYEKKSDGTKGPQLNEEELKAKILEAYPSFLKKVEEKKQNSNPDEPFMLYKGKYYDDNKLKIELENFLKKNFIYEKVYPSDEEDII